MIANSGVDGVVVLALRLVRLRVAHLAVFGFSHQTAPQLVSFLRKYKAHLEQVTGVRYSGELGHPFHVVDDDLVILSLDHPYYSRRTFCALGSRPRARSETDGRIPEAMVESHAECSRN